jgi:RNA polymerase sigma-70 factor, ECF subfamily
VPVTGTANLGPQGPQGPVADERELVLRARQGDAAAFEQVLDRHQERVTRVIHSILRDPRDTEEVAQDVFLTIFARIEAFRGEASFTTWIHRIAVNAALMRRRRDRVGAHAGLADPMPTFDADGHIAVDVVDWTDRADDPALRAEASAVIQQAVEALGAKYRTVFLLRDVEGFSTEQTAGILGLGVPAVKSRLHRARLSLRRALAGYFERQPGA